jgi:hypothetical protein
VCHAVEQRADRTPAGIGHRPMVLDREGEFLVLGADAELIRRRASPFEPGDEFVARLDRGHVDLVTGHASVRLQRARARPFPGRAQKVATLNMGTRKEQCDGATLLTGQCPQRACFRPLAAVYRFRHGGRAFGAANLLEMRNVRQAVELHNCQCQKQIDATVQHAEGFIEGDRNLGLAAGRRARLGNAPMGGDWLARPDAASSQTMNTKWRSGASGRAKSSQDFGRKSSKLQPSLRSKVTAC